MFVLRDAVLLFSLVAACLRQQLQIISTDDSSKADSVPNTNESNSSLKVEELTSNYFSSSDDLTTVGSIESTTKQPIPVSHDYPMSGDDPSVYNTVVSFSQLSPEYTADYSPTNFHEGMSDDVESSDKPSNYATTSLKTDENFPSRSQKPHKSQFPDKPVEKSFNNVSNHFSTSDNLTTFGNIESTTKQSIPVSDDYPMSGDDPSVYNTVVSFSQLSPEHTADYSPTNFHEGMSGDVESSDKPSNYATTSLKTDENFPSRSQKPQKSQFPDKPVEKSFNNVSNHFSTSDNLTTFGNIELTTEQSIPVSDDYPMSGDDPSVYNTADSFRQLSPEHTADYSPTNFHEGMSSAVGLSGVPSNDTSTPLSTDENVQSGRHKPQLLQPIKRSGKELMNDAFSNFIMNYLTVIFQHHKNIVTSPISIADLMLLTSYGACLHTLETIDIIPNLPHEIRSDLRLIKSFVNRHSIETNGMVVGYRMFIRNNIDLSKRYSKIAQRIFNSSLQQINFMNVKEAAKIINNWSANQTRNMITNVVNADQFNNETDLVLISVAAYNCNWLKPFDPNRTQEMEFFDTGISKKVWTMNQEIECRYGMLQKLYNSTYVELFIDTTSVGNPMRMIIILPGEATSLSKIVPELREFKLEDLNVNEEKDVLVNVSLPRFKIKTTTNLKDHQQAMKIENIFSDIANFRRITKTRYLKVNDFIQMSVIDVNEGNYHSEKYTSAGTNKVGVSKIRKNFHVNRPFIILIANNDIIFVMAQVVDPSL